MKQITSDKDTKSKKQLALAKVYRLLILLAEKSENEAIYPKVIGTTEEKIGDPSSVTTEASD